VRRLLLALALALAAPALAQTPPPETITFEGLAGLTPIPYEPGVKVPKTARLKKVTLAGGGYVSFRTRGSASYVALVNHFGTTAIAAVAKNGKIQVGRFLDLRIRKAKDAAFDSMVAIQAGARNDDKGTTDTADDELVFDAPGDAGFRMYYGKKNSLYPLNGTLLSLVRAVDPEAFVKDPYDLTTTSKSFHRVEIAGGFQVGDVVIDDLVVSYGH
jgi:hypothetical protein